MPKWTTRPLTPARWKDLETLFGPNGACAGCWCMFFRLPRSEWSENAGDANRRAFEALVKSRAPSGVLAYRDDVPVGWCAIAPREDYGALERSKKYRRLDDTPVWSITCFYISRSARGEGVMRRLVDAAVRYAGSRGAPAVEAYPVEPARDERVSGSSAGYHGILSVFEDAGFLVEARPSGARAIVRKRLHPKRARSTR